MHQSFGALILKTRPPQDHKVTLGSIPRRLVSRRSKIPSALHMLNGLNPVAYSEHLGSCKRACPPPASESGLRDPGMAKADQRDHRLRLYTELKGWTRAITLDFSYPAIQRCAERSSASSRSVYNVRALTRSIKSQIILTLGF